MATALAFLTSPRNPGGFSLQMNHQTPGEFAWEFSCSFIFILDAKFFTIWKLLSKEAKSEVRSINVRCIFTPVFSSWRANGAELLCVMIDARPAFYIKLIYQLVDNVDGYLHILPSMCWENPSSIDTTTSKKECTDYMTNGLGTECVSAMGVRMCLVEQLLT